MTTRILMLSWEYPPHVVGGLGRHTAELSPALVREGVDLHLITPVTKETEAAVTVEQGITVHRVLAPIRDKTANVYDRAVEINNALECYLQRLNPKYGRFDLIHTHDWLTSFAGIHFQSAEDCPLVATIHATERGRNRGHISNDLQQAINDAEHNLVDQARRIIVCSHHMASEVQYFFQTPLDKLEIVPNGVNITNLNDGIDPDSLAGLRARYVAPDQQLVFTIARLVYEKGIHLLVEAAPLVLEECPQARFIIAGKGPEATNLKQQAQNLGVADKINFIGFIPDKVRNQLLQVADCAIFPSLYEPFGIVALEAMALGAPLIVSDVGGFSEMVKHAKTGIKIYPDNVDSTAWGIVHTLRHPDWAKKHAIKARQAVEELFNWPRIARLTIEVYHHTLRKNIDSNS